MAEQARKNLTKDIWGKNRSTELAEQAEQHKFACSALQNYLATFYHKDWTQKATSNTVVGTLYFS